MAPAPKDLQFLKNFIPFGANKDNPNNMAMIAGIER